MRNFEHINQVALNKSYTKPNTENLENFFSKVSKSFLETFFKKELGSL